MPVRIAFTARVVPIATHFLHSTVVVILVIVTVFSGEPHSQMVRQRVTFDHNAGKQGFASHTAERPSFIVIVVIIIIIIIVVVVIK